MATTSYFGDNSLIAYITKFFSETVEPMFASKSEMDLIRVKYSKIVDSQMTMLQSSLSSSFVLMSLFSRKKVFNGLPNLRCGGVVCQNHLEKRLSKSYIESLFHNRVEFAPFCIGCLVRKAIKMIKYGVVNAMGFWRVLPMHCNSIDSCQTLGT